MTYTVCFDLFLDGDVIYNQEEISECLKEMLDSAAIDVSNVRILDIKD